MGTKTRVHWREGMFLRPQHFQALARQLGARTARGETFGRPGFWGVVSLEADPSALTRGVFSILRGEVLFGDGELATIPQDTAVEPREFSELFVESSLDVYLGLCSITPNLALAQTEDGQRARYAVKTRELSDENIGTEARPVEVRELLGRLFFGDEDRSGYECIQIARLVRGERPKVEPMLDPTYIAPVLACSASPALITLLERSSKTLRSRANELAATVPNMTNLSFAEKGADISGLVMLQAVNAALSSLEVVTQAPEASPFDAYQAMAHAIGNLAIFGDDRVSPRLPQYDHDDLTDCFSTAEEWLNQFTVAQPTAPYDALPFVEDPTRPGISSLDLEPDWAESAVHFFLGVELAAEGQEAQSLVASGVKLVSPEDMEKVIRNVLAGIELEYVRRPPIAFPSRSGLHYFRINTEGSSRDQWLRVLGQRKAIVLSTLSAVGKDAKFQMFVELPK